MRIQMVIVGAIAAGAAGLAAAALVHPGTATILAIMFALLASGWSVVIWRELARLREELRKASSASEQAARTTVPFSLADLDLDDPIISYHGQWLVRWFIEQVAQLGRRDMRLTFELNSELRLRMLYGLHESAFATLVVSKVAHLWTTKEYSPYRTACADAARRLPKGFTRVFVFSDETELTPDVEELLAAHLGAGYDTRVVLKDILRRQGLDPELDFGIWDSHWVTTLVLDEDRMSTIAPRARYLGQREEVERFSEIAGRIKTFASPAGKWLRAISRPIESAPDNQDLLKSRHATVDQGCLSDPAIMSRLVARLRDRRGAALIQGLSAARLLALHEADALADVDVLSLAAPDSDMRSLCDTVGVRCLTLEQLLENQESDQKKRVHRYSAVVLCGITQSLRCWQIRPLLRQLANVMAEPGRLLMATLVTSEDPGAIDPSEIEERVKALREGGGLREPILRPAELLPLVLASDCYSKAHGTVNSAKWAMLTQCHAAVLASALDISEWGDFGAISAAALQGLVRGLFTLEGVTVPYNRPTRSGGFRWCEFVFTPGARDRAPT